ncbi:hypothetical protein OG225_31290 [Nocardia sp. NBC_01377]|uniref:hypothetical protein n=1 Tax=Nocardia sp. NBC_01377 TaxID=2903595 RepID=UPI003247CE5B
MDGVGAAGRMGTSLAASRRAREGDPSEQWTLIGGLMVQLHAVRAGLPASRAMVDVDMVLHIETGNTTFGGVREQLEKLGYTLRLPIGDGPVHRFERADEQVDVMVADHLAPKWQPKVLGIAKACFDVEIGDTTIRLSVPDVLGALVLKGAAYKADPRDPSRHLDDAAVLACAVDNPMDERKRMQGSDHGRVLVLAKQLESVDHRSWSGIPVEHRSRGHRALQLIAGVSTGSRVGARRRLRS